jgi:hypothetical protein
MIDAASASGAAGQKRVRAPLGMMDQDGKGAIKWTRLSCRTFAANAARLQLHALARPTPHVVAKNDGE